MLLSEMVRKQTYITPRQEAALKRLARDRRTTEAELIRAALDQYLHSATLPDDGDPLRALLDLAPNAKGPADGSVEHDRDIYRA